MGQVTGFLAYKRELAPERPPLARIEDWNAFHASLSDEMLMRQGARCMDCGVPYCSSGFDLPHGTSGCPVNNLIPEWNDLVSRGLWEEALLRLQKTNNFPEFTGSICPAPCEHACTVGLIGEPVTIKEIELSIIERGFAAGWVQANRPKVRTGKRVAIVGSGPAGLACADQLNSAGHEVTIFERSAHPGGLLTYGIPPMKLEKSVVWRRFGILKDAGVRFVLNAEIGSSAYPIGRVQMEYDAVVLCIGATKPKELRIEGKAINGVHYALDYLHENVRAMLAGQPVGEAMSADGKDVIILGGGDTGTDCVATALRQGCRSVTQFGIHEQLPTTRDPDNPWPQFARVHQLDYGHAEATARFGRDPRAFSIQTTRIQRGRSGDVEGVETVELIWETDSAGKTISKMIPGTTKVWPAHMVLLAMGYQGPEEALLEQLGLERDERTNVKADARSFATNVPGVFAAGDVRRGQSLVVWAIREGRDAARACDEYLMGVSHLP